VTWAPGDGNLIHDHERDFVTVYLDGGSVRTTSADGTSRVETCEPGDLVFEGQGTAAAERNVSESDSVRAVVIDLKDTPVTPLLNTSGYPKAFPRPGVRIAFENDRVVVWNYTWIPEMPTPTHFHDKYVVVVYLEDGELESRTPDGNSVVNEVWFGRTTAIPRNRVHSEELVSGRARAIILEMK
jgi:quercetin dioxygenase-like cupin family protein